MKTLIRGLFFICPLFSYAQTTLPVHVVPKEDRHIKWQPQALMLMDERAAMPFPKAWAALEQGRFSPLQKDSLPGYLSFGHWVYWLAFVFDNPSPDTLRFVVEIAGQDTIWVRNGSASLQTIGAPSPFPARDRLGLLTDPLLYGQTYAIRPHQRDTLLLKRTLVKPSAYLMPRFSTPQTYVALHQQDTLHPRLVYALFRGSLRPNTRRMA